MRTVLLGEEGADVTTEHLFTYQGENTNEISFPLGGIGSGSIGLAGNGALVDWEIFNHPCKGSLNAFSHFALRAESDGEVLDARILQSDLAPPYSGTYRKTWFYEGFGWGPRRETMAGFPHFSQSTFHGAFPFAQIDFTKSPFPGTAQIEAFSPFIPLNERDSSFPAAFFTITLTNTTKRPLDYSVISVMSNPHRGPRLNQYQKMDGHHALQLQGGPGASKQKELVLMTDAPQVSYQEYLYRGPWFDNLETYWQDMLTPGPFPPRQYKDEADLFDENSDFCQYDSALLASHFRLASGESRKVRFLLTWYVPQRENDWGRLSAGNPYFDTPEVKASRNRTWKNHYATLWDSAKDVAQEAMRRWDELENKTRLFQKALTNTSLPPSALDALVSNLSILRSPTVLRLEDGTFYGWEGVGLDRGSCEGSCSHVWNYAQALPFLFPSLEQSMRHAEFTYNLREDGGLTFRLMLPLGSPRWDFRPCVDGQFGTIMKCYREWKMSGNTPWLAQLWPKIKAALAFAWSSENKDQWDPQQSGVLTGRQHHTLDMELFGPNSWLTGMYLGALEAGRQMAQALGDLEAATLYQEIFERGKEFLNTKLYNGHYYVQKINLANHALLTNLPDAPGGVVGRSTHAAYWSKEHKQLKYQAGEGLLIDQGLGQWHASLYGLGEIFEPNQLRCSLKQLHHHNFAKEMREHYNPCRLFCLNDESGLVICSWPEDAEKPAIPIPYAQETMNGLEYAAAVQMLQNGLETEAYEIIEAVRARYDGKRRNPWNEFESGSNYARSLASYSILLAASGFQFDATQDMMGFSPLHHGQYFWCFNTGWGVFQWEENRGILNIDYGHLTLRKLRLPQPEKIKGIVLGEKRYEFTIIQASSRQTEVQLLKPLLLDCEKENQLRIFWKDSTPSKKHT